MLSKWKILSPVPSTLIFDDPLKIRVETLSKSDCVDSYPKGSLGLGHNLESYGGN